MMNVKDGTPETNSHWTQIFDKPIVCVDFHHTITKNCPACPDFSGSYILQDDVAKDSIIRGCDVKEAMMILKKWFRIIIFTGNPDGLDFIKSGRYKEEIKEFLDENEIPYDKIMFTKPPAMFIIDDRGIHHESWTKTIEEVLRRSQIEVE